MIAYLGASLLLPEFAFVGVAELSAALLHARLVYTAVAVHVVDSYKRWILQAAC